MAKIDSNVYAPFLDEIEYTRYVDVFTNLDMAFVQQAIGGAEAGNLGNLYQLYEFLENSDARLKGMLNNRRKAVTKNTYTVTSANGGDAELDEPTAFVTKQIASLNWRQLIAELMDGRIYGVMMHQKVWKLGADGRLCYEALVPVNKGKYGQENTGYEGSGMRFGELYVDRFGYGTEKISAKRLQADNAIVLAVDKAERGRYDQQGLMRGVARWYLIKLFAIKAWAQYAEKYGQPIITATVAQDMYEANKGLLKRLLSSVGANKYGVLLEGMNVQMTNPLSTANIDAFDRLISLCNTEMAIAILGQNLTTDVSGGSFAASKTHMEVLANLVEDDIQWLDEVVNNEIIAPLIRVNWPELGVEDYPVYKTYVPETLDLDNMSRGLQQVAKLIPIPQSYLYKKLGIPVPKEGEQVIGGNGGDPLEELLGG